LRIKESDRIDSTVTTLSALGANIKAEGDDIIIRGKASLQGGIVNSHNDHRIAMMVSMAALVCENEVTLHGASAVNKSYPHFFEDYKSIGGKFQIKE